MRRCPICQRTYDDNMKFCQSDGTSLVDDASDIGGSDDPFKTVLAEGAPADEPEFDPMKTMLATPPPVSAPPPTPFSEPETRLSQDLPLNAPPFGDLGAPQFNNAPLPSEPVTPLQDNYSGGFGQPPSEPFGEPQPQRQSSSFDNSPRTPTFQDPEPPPQFGGQANFGQQQFGQQANEWTPPPVPQTGWDNQGLGQNTPFSAPPINAGISQTLPIVSLALGIGSITIGWCCYLGFILGPAALITGFIGLNQIKSNPQQYGGRNLAIAGMAVGGAAMILQILLVILGIFLNLAALGLGR